MPAALPFLPAISAGASLVGGLFGGDEEGSAPQQTTQNQISGFAALPPQVQQAYLQQYLPGVLQNYTARHNQYPGAMARTDPYASQSLQELQNHYDSLGTGNGARPLGGPEPLNPIQKAAFGQAFQGYNPQTLQGYINPYTQQALNAYSQQANQQPGQGTPYDVLGPTALGNQLGGYNQAFGGLTNVGSQQDYAKQYHNPYTEQVTNNVLARMKEQLAGGQNSILSDNALTGSLGAFGSSALGTMLANRQNEGLKAANEYQANQAQRGFEQSQAYGQQQQARDIAQRNLELERSLGQRNRDVGTGLENYYKDIGLHNQALGSLAQVGQNAFGQGQQFRQQSLQDLLNAGNQVQTQNQNEVTASQAYREQHNPQASLAQLAQNLNQIPGSNTGQSFQYGQAQPNMVSRIGQTASGLNSYVQGGMGGLFGQQKPRFGDGGSLVNGQWTY